MKTLLLLIAAHAFGCNAVEGDRILARDLAAANPAFATLDQKLAIAIAPIPGVSRVFRPEEIARIAKLNGITPPLPIAELCFERATEQLTVAKLMPVLRAATGIDDALIEILDFSRAGLPRGVLSFARTGLSSAGLWRGHLTYDETRTAPVWVKVRITAERVWVEAAQPIAAGKLVEVSQLIARKGPRFPFGVAPIDSLDIAVARKPLRSIRVGEAIYPSMLISPREVERGDVVRVDVSSGEARLEFDAVAQSSARIGESVLLKNPETGRFFKARVDDRGKASIAK